jgi:chemotaxis protein CheX
MVETVGLMNAKYIAPITTAVQNVFGTMIGLPAVAGRAYFKKEKQPTAEVVSMISMSGPVSGFVGIGISSKLAFLLAAKLLECTIEGPTESCIDAIGEITNMIAGNAKSEFPDPKISISVPKVWFNPSGPLYPDNVPIITSPFDVQGEAFLVDMAVIKAKEVRAS